MVQTLAEHGLISRPAPSRRQWLGWGAGLAATVAAFLTGRATAARRNAPPSSGRRWMPLLYEDAGFEPAPPGRAGERAAEHGRWAGAQRREGRFVEGDELAPGGFVLAGQGRPPPDPAPGPLGRLSGYFVITAGTEAEAREAAATCPHLAHRGRIAINPIGPPPAR